MATKKPSPHQKVLARQIRAGDIISPKGTKRKEVVRNVTIILHLANGVDEIHETTDAVTLYEPEQVDE